jgi:hypothetical protein
MSKTKQIFRIACRVVVFVCLAALIGWVLNEISDSLERDHRPAGFGRGMLQGALMPMSMPNLLVGKDITIYSASNTGVKYKLGYTLGVNVCGAAFFGFFFLRVARWRKAALRTMRTAD